MKEIYLQYYNFFSLLSSLDDENSLENVFEDVDLEDDNAFEDSAFGEGEGQGEDTAFENVFEQITMDDDGSNIDDVFGDISIDEDISSPIPDSEEINLSSDEQQKELQAQSYQFFLEESVDLIAVIDENLEDVFVNRDINDINEVARCAHSLKGGARSSGLEDLGMVALRVEKSLKALFNDSIPLDESIKCYIRELYSLLKEAIFARIENQDYDEATARDTANQMWEQFEAQFATEIAESEEFLPSSSDLGIDIATSIFEIDVLEGISNLQQILTNSYDAPQIQEAEVIGQIEVFIGFGEMLALPGFVSVCQTAQKAIQENSSALTTIVNVFIDDLLLSRDAVLDGDRVSGGHPSEQLLQLAGESPFTEIASSTAPTKPDSYVDVNDPAYGFFIEEVPELLQIIESGLLNLREQERNTAQIHEIMRAAHSLKGGAASVGLDAIKTIAHQIEDVFKVLYDPAIEIDTELETWLLESFDCLTNALNTQIQTGSYDEEEALETANEIWAKINGKLGSALSRVDDYIPSSSDLGVDIVQSMFEVDVAEELNRLRNVITQPVTEPLTGELRATLEVFSGFGEMLNLSGFASIGQLGLEAIDRNPSHLVTITKVIIHDVEQARDLVLRGDRTTGGKPSEQLIYLAQQEISSGENPQQSLRAAFADQATQLDEIFQLTAFDKDTQTNDISIAEESFDLDPEDFEIENLQSIDSAIDSIAELEDIFASDLEPEEISLLTKASELALEDDKNKTIPSVEEIFSLPDFDEIILEEEKVEEFELPAMSEMDDAFIEEVIINKDTSEFPTELRQKDDVSMEDVSLEDVFGGELLDEDTKDDLIARAESNEDNENEFVELVQPPALQTPKQAHKQTLLNIPPEELLKQQKELEREIKQKLEAEELEVEEVETEEVEVEEIDTSAPATLAQALQSIGDIYEKLPALDQKQKLKNTTGKKVATDTTISSKVDRGAPLPSASTKTNLTIRVDLDRLERMNNLIGELSINRNGLSLQNNKLQGSVQDLLERFGNFQQIANNLRDLSDKMLVSPETFSNPAVEPVVNNNLDTSFTVSEDEEFNLSSAFDALEMDRYDNLYNVVQGLIEQMIQLEESVEDIALFASQSGETVENQRQMLNRLRDELMWARMLPLSEILNRFPRVLRDLSVKYNKKVNLKLDGTSVLVDKAALEKLYDPLVHLIRNAFDHGIETPEIRRQKGKPIMGVIQVKAYHQGNQTIIEIKDDGGGLNLQRIGQKAIENKLITPDDLSRMSQDALLDLIFEPGFSTAPSVTEISGRGVGLDIVRSQLRALKGNISVESEPGVGTTFILKLPLTLTIDKLLVLSTGVNFYALPSDNIAEIIVPESKQIKMTGEQRFLHYENQVIPIYGLNRLLNYRCHVTERMSGSTSLEILPTPEEWGNPLLVVALGKELFAIEVEHLVSEQELVIKPFGKALNAPGYTYGCTILGDGTLIPVINTVALLANFFRMSQGGSTPTLTSTPSDAEMEKMDQSRQTMKSFEVASVLIVDDSAAMRRTLALSLEKAGYRVIQAKDGKEALEQLQQMNNISLVICDIEMPNMNGFEFLGQRRRYPELTKIPVAMLTSRSNDKHRKLATHLGANAYFTKPYIEQKFLQSINDLIDNRSLVRS